MGTLGLFSLDSVLLMSLFEVVLDHVTLIGDRLGVALPERI